MSARRFEERGRTAIWGFSCPCGPAGVGGRPASPSHATPLVRLDLTDFEASAAKLRQIEAAEREAAAQKLSQGETVSTKGGRGNKGGVRDAARRTGLDKEEVRIAEAKKRRRVPNKRGRKGEGRPKGGDAEASRRTGLSRREVQRTKKRSQGDIRLRAERRIGEMLAETVQHQGGTVAACDRRPVGISKTQSSRWQRIARIPEERFEEELAKPEPSTWSGR